MNGQNDDIYSLAKFPYYYYGRGFVQLTWFDNYLEFAKLLKVDLLLNPQLACNVDIATEIMIYGMLKGTFTGKKLSDYLKKRLNQNEGIVYLIDEDENYTDLMVAEDSEEYRYE